MTKMTKSESNYSKGMIHSHCGKVFPNDSGYCKHFKGAGDVTKDGVCEVVEGPISPVYWCKEFSAAKK